jgi:ribonuclease-3
LQELLQAKRMPLPEYEVKQILGPAHAQTFRVICKTVLTDSVIGSGFSRRKAEQDAADKVLKLISE